MISKIVQYVNKKIQLQLQKTLSTFNNVATRLRIKVSQFWIIVCNLMVENNFNYLLTVNSYINIDTSKSTQGYNYF